MRRLILGETEGWCCLCFGESMTNFELGELMPGLEAFGITTVKRLRLSDEETQTIHS